MLKFKTMLGIVAIFGLMAVPMVFAAPLRKYVNQNANGDLLRTQDQDRLRRETATALAIARWTEIKRGSAYMNARGYAITKQKWSSTNIGIKMGRI